MQIAIALVLDDQNKLKKEVLQRAIQNPSLRSL